MKTIVIGGGSFIAKQFIDFCKKSGTDFFFTDYKSEKHKYRFDLQKPNFSILPTSNDYNYAIITAGIPNIAFCEKNISTSYLCNVSTQLALGKFFVKNGITPIFFSSDYVFNKKNLEHTEASSVSPITEYGRQKAELERKIPQVCGNNYLIFRLSKVYGQKPGDNTLFDEMFQVLMKKENIQAAYDQIFCPVNTKDVVKAIFLAQKQRLRGLYNLCGPRIVSRYQLALEVAKAIGLKDNRVLKVSLDDLPLGCKRSKYTAMSNMKLSEKLSLQFQSHEETINSLKKLYLSSIIPEIHR